MKRLLLLCLTAAVLVSCLGLSAQAAPTLSWTEFYTMGDAASAHTRIDPINQIVGYLLSEDPTYITNHNNARSLICKLDRDELLQELVRHYLFD